jgi:hypothetical protein
MNYCKFCFNAYVHVQLLEEENSDEECLDDTNDFSSATIGSSDRHIQMYINSGHGAALSIETCKWGEDNRWHTVALYYPKYCPECGRKLDEYLVDSRGKTFKKKEV